MLEIERKFLVTSTDFIEKAHSKTKIIQGFLNTDPERTVRVRLKDNKGFLTIKGKSDDGGISRFEWETSLSKEDAEQLLTLSETKLIEKIRYNVVVGNHTFEIDVFLGANEGLIVAEIELKYATEPFKKPFWLGKEITGQKQYYNSQLSLHPFNTWDN